MNIRIYFWKKMVGVAAFSSSYHLMPSSWFAWFWGKLEKGKDVVGLMLANLLKIGKSHQCWFAPRCDRKTVPTYHIYQTWEKKSTHTHTHPSIPSVDNFPWKQAVRASTPQTAVLSWPAVGQHAHIYPIRALITLPLTRKHLKVTLSEVRWPRNTQARESLKRMDLLFGILALK